MSNVRAMEWKNHPRFPVYEISEFGDVRRLTDSPTRKKGSRPRGFIDADGYLRYQLINQIGEKSTITAHRLVLETFSGVQPTESHEVAHNDGSRVHNHYSNLRWVLPVENHADKYIHHTSSTGEQNGRARLNETAVRAIKKERINCELTSDRIRFWAALFNVSESAIYGAANGKSWSHVN